MTKCLDIKSRQRCEYGDWQTGLDLALQVCRHLKAQGVKPQAIVEPTCGTGTFVEAALLTFDSIEKVIGIEINGAYLQQAATMANRVVASLNRHVDVTLLNKNIFDVSFDDILYSLTGLCVLVVGNPPWVTNSKLSSMDSGNVPQKSNFKRLRGIDAVTGKGNFDIAENICLRLLFALRQSNATIALLLKKSVARALVHVQRTLMLPVQFRQHDINALAEFGANVSACLFEMRMGKEISLDCQVGDFYSGAMKYRYGWVGDKFVSDIQAYQSSRTLDGKSPLKWRSGMKHDCSRLMELTKVNGQYLNGLNHVVDIEDETIYPFVKSSDLKDGVVTGTRKYVVLTHSQDGDTPDALREKSPKTYHYLLANASYLDNRKSAIYRNRPRFSQFGIGAYSFKKYKVVISGLYKNTHFSLVPDIEGKVAMVDDTCYSLGFDNYNFAVICQRVLNSKPVQDFIHSVFFLDAKRVVTKDLLMRIDIMAAARSLGFENLRVDKSEFQAFMAYLQQFNNPVQRCLF